MSALYTCCDARRRSLVRAHPNLNGIDFLEVDDDPQQPSQRQRTLRVRLLNHHRVASLTLANLRVDGGERVRSLKVLTLDIAADQLTLGAKISVYATSSGGASAHLVHRNDGKADGTIVIDPEGPSPTMLLFHFPTQSF